MQNQQHQLQKRQAQLIAVIVGGALGSALVITGCGGSSGGGLGSDAGLAGTSRLSQVSTRAGQNVVKIYSDGTYRHVQSNGIPDHAIGTFPNPDCPNTLTAQNYNFKMPAKPKASVATAVGMNPFGVAVNGIPFDPAAAMWWKNDQTSIWQYEPLSTNVHLGLDQNFAHVQPNGSYHYHGLPTGLLTKLNANSKMALIGWAADGFPIYGPNCYSKATDKTSGLKAMRSSYRLKTGTRPSGTSGPGGTYDGTFTADYAYVAGSGDLDEFNGRTGVTPDFPSGTYYYVLSTNWPIIPRKWRGSPDASFLRGGSGNGPGGTPMPPNGTPGPTPGGPGGTPVPPSGTPKPPPPTPGGTVTPPPGTPKPPPPTPGGTPTGTPTGTPKPPPPPPPTPGGTPQSPPPTPSGTPKLPPPGGTPQSPPPTPNGTPMPPPGGGTPPPPNGPGTSGLGR